MSHVTSRSCDGMWNMKHEEWCHKWCHMEKGYKHGKSYLNQGLRYIFRIIKAWRPCEWQKGINVIENKRIMRIKKRYSWIYLTGKWIHYSTPKKKSSQKFFLCTHWPVTGWSLRHHSWKSYILTLNEPQDKILIPKEIRWYKLQHIIYLYFFSFASLCNT